MNIEKLEYEVPTENIKYNKIFLLTDTHFGIRANSLEWAQNQANFFYNFYIPFLKKNVKKGDILFFLGDWFDNRQLLDIYIMNISIDIIIKLSEILPLYFITGNHDIYKKNDTDVNSLRPFRNIDNVKIFEKPTIVTNGNSDILVLPWVGDKEKEEKYTKYNKADFIFAHTTITGFRYDNGLRIYQGADLTDIKGVKRVITGHIHKRQEIGNVIYIGSPYHIKRGDIGNQKGVYILNPENNKIDFFENSMSSIFQRIPLEDLMEYNLEQAYEILNNNYTDIIVPDKYVHKFNLTRFIELLEDCKYKRIEARGEKIKIDDDLTSIIDGEDIKDIITLLETSIEDLQYQMEFLIKIKKINKFYYNKALKEENE